MILISNKPISRSASLGIPYLIRDTNEANRWAAISKIKGINWAGFVTIRSQPVPRETHWKKGGNAVYFGAYIKTILIYIHDYARAACA